MKLQEYINFVNPAIFKEARAFIKSEDFVSLKNLGDHYEGAVIYEDGLIFAEVVIDKNDEIQKYSCNCRNSNTLCIHIAAIMLGIEKMLKAGCSDYHEALKRLTPHDLLYTDNIYSQYSAKKHFYSTKT